MIETFLSVNKNKKLLIVHHVIANNMMTITELEEKLDISAKQIKRYIREINDDSFTLSNTIIFDKNGEDIYLLPMTKQESLALYNDLTHSYLNDSSLFQIILLLTTHDRLALPTILKELSMSRSFFYKQLKKLNVILAIHGLEIKTSNSIFYLSGKEIAIRLFSFHFMVECTKHGSWHFPYTTKTEIHHCFPQLSSLLSATLKSNDKFYIFFAILQNRIKYHHYLIDDLNIVSYTNAIEKEKELSVISFDNFKKYLEAQQLFDTELQMLEFRYFIFFTHAYLSELYDESEIIFFLENLEENSRKRKEYPFILEIITEWAKKFHIPKDSYKDIKHFCILFMIASIDLKLTTKQAFPLHNLDIYTEHNIDTKLFTSLSDVIKNTIKQSQFLNSNSR